MKVNIRLPFLIFTLFFLAGCFEQKVEVEKGNRVK